MARYLLRLFNTVSRASLRVNHTSSMCTFYKDNIPVATKVPVVVPTRKSRTSNVLMNELMEAGTHKEVLKLVSQHSQIFDKRHVKHTMSTLFKFAKDNPRISTDIINHPGFDGLCSSLKKHCRTMRNAEIIDILKILTFLEVPGNSMIYQIMLQLIKQNINHLQLSEIIFLDFVLKRCNNTNLSEALKLALPLVFQIQLNMQLDHENLPGLMSVLRYAVSNNITERALSNVITCLLLHSDNLDYTSAESILRSLSTLQGVPEEAKTIKLINHCFDVLNKNVGKLSYESVIRLLNIMKDRIADIKDDIFYDKKFFDECGKFAIANDVGYQKAVQICKIFIRLNHNSFELLDYISEKLSQDLSLIMYDFYLLVYVNCLATCNYKPNAWDLIWQRMKELDKSCLTNSNLPGVRFCRDLAILNCYDDEMLNIILSEEYMRRFAKRNNTMMDFVHLITVYEAVKCFRPSLVDIFVPNEHLVKGSNALSQKIVDESLMSFLELALGGPNYLASNVCLPNGLFVDFLIGYDDTKRPVPLNNIKKNRILNYSELNVKDCKQTVCIIGYYPSYYSKNSGILKGHFELEQRILERLGHKVLVVNIERWNEMPDTEKISYITREINYKLVDELENSHDVIL